LILDTHIWLWVVNGNAERLSPETIVAIENASCADQLGVSVISVWEVGMLESKGRIVVPEGGQTWVKAALTAPGLRLLPLTPEIALASSQLPGQIHGDPADRILVATARILKGTLVTCDQPLLDYGRQSHFSMMPG
jgi:PIN domain nuclease of toxin-antitoxin system